VLGEDYAAAVEGFLEAGDLEPTDLATRLAWQFTVPQLRERLRASGQPVSGRKDLLVQRLVDAAPEAAEEAVADLRLLQCSGQGRAALEGFLTSLEQGGVTLDPECREVLSSEGAPAAPSGLAPIAEPILRAAAAEIDAAAQGGADPAYEALQRLAAQVKLSLPERAATAAVDERPEPREVKPERPVPAPPPAEPPSQAEVEVIVVEQTTTAGGTRTSRLMTIAAWRLPGQSAEQAAIGWYNRALAQDQRGRYGLAIVLYTRALALDPNSVDAYNNRGLCFDALGMHHRAVADYTRAIELDPGYAYAYNNRGLSYYALGEFESAVTDYTRAIELDPGYAYAYNNRGNSYHALGEHERALADYDRALEIDPAYGEALHNRALVERRQGD
jgi:tetratricopeptide (TPR) repeat protein